MHAYRSIGRKLGLLALLSVAVAVVIGTAFALTQETQRYVEAKSEAFIATAQVFAAAVADAPPRATSRRRSGPCAPLPPCRAF